MRSFSALLAVALLATCTSAGSPVTMPLTRIRRTAADLRGPSVARRSRGAALLRHRALNGSTDASVTGLAYTQHTTKIGIGEPPRYYNLVIDTASANIICGTSTPYVQTPTRIATGQNVNVTYLTNQISGKEYLDRVTLAPNLIVNQFVGDALLSDGFDFVDGVIGFGPFSLSSGTLSPETNATIPSTIGHLAAQGMIKNRTLGIYFTPPTNYTDKIGALTYGGVDPSLYKGELTYVPVTKTRPSSQYWGFNMSSATYGNDVIFSNSSAGIIDTMMSQVLLAEDYFTEYLNAIPGAKWDSDLELIEIPSASISFMRPLKLVIGDRVFSFNVPAQLVPEGQNVEWGGITGKQYGVIGKLNTHSGHGMDFVVGQKFLERYYVALDEDNNRIGFAETNYTFSTTEG